MRCKHTRTSGFTLIEMIVAVALFAVVMLVCVGALLSMVSANRKAQALQSVMNNLNITLDSMVRPMREGNSFNGYGTTPYCSQNTGGGPNDCSGGGSKFSFKSYDNADVVYLFDLNGSVCGANRLCKSDTNGLSWSAITAPEIFINDMRFFVVGTTRLNDAVEPKVVIVIKGSAGAAGTKARTTFHIQATAVQRVLDL